MAERIFPFQTAKQIAETCAPDVDWILEGYVAAGCLTELDGKAKAAGKTTFTLSLCRAVLDGQYFIGRRTRQAKIVYLTEQSATSFKKGLRHAGLLGRDDFTVLHWYHTIGHKWEMVARQAVRECERRGAELLVIDTLPQFAKLIGDSENNAGDALAALMPLQEAAAKHGLAVIIIRHERKGGGEVGDSGRGSSAFAGGVDIILALRRGEGNSKPTVRLIHALSRFDETPDKLAIELTDNGYVAAGSSGALAVEQARAAVLRVVPMGLDHAMTEPEIKLASGLKRTVLQQAIKELQSVEALQRTGKGTKGSPFRYYRPEKDSTPTQSTDRQPSGIHSAATTLLDTAESDGGRNSHGHCEMLSDAPETPEEAQAILANDVMAEQKLPAELEWRVEGMRNLLPEPGTPIPLLVASESAEPKRGECFSCAQPLPPAQPGRLRVLWDLCAAAKRIVLGLEPASNFIN